MLKHKIVLITTIILSAFILYNCKEAYKDPNYSIKDRVQDLLQRMTLDEKITILSRSNDLYVPGIERLGIPSLKLVNGPHGVGEGQSTCFPAGVGLAATWNEKLLYDIGTAIGKEAQAKGCNILLAPTINIHRIPVAGRNFESYSEDPFLSARMGVNFVRGVQSQGVATCLKHYAVNNQEWERYSINVVADERTMREIYLPAFEAVIKEAQPMTIMSSYNKINGVYGSHHKYLLDDILRKEWDFTGLIVSDNGAIHDVKAAVDAGVDIENPGPQVYYGKPLKHMITEGKINQKKVDEKVRRVLTLIFELGLMDDPNLLPEGALNAPEHQDLALLTAREAIVLLRNKNNILPLNKDKIKTIAVIGPNASSIQLGGGGSSEVKPFYSVSPLQGLEKKLGASVKIFHNAAIEYPEDFPVIESKFLVPPNAEKGEFGLKGEYFNNDKLAGKPVFSRIDKKIDFNWKREAPAEGINDNNFSVRWTGKLIAPKTDKIRIGISSNDGSRLYIDNELFVHNWGLHATKMKSNEIHVVKGKEYDIKIEYFEAGNNANVKLEWQLEKPKKIFDKEALKIAKKAEVAIIFAGLNKDFEGEGFDRETMNMPGNQDELIKAVAKVNKNTIVVLNNGSPVSMNSWINDVAAVVEAWYLGQETGSAIADVLAGDYNPSGKLPVTFPKEYEDNPVYKNYPGDSGNVYFREGLYVGYRYYDTKKVEPLFPFGYGLSYTSYEYNDLKLKSNDDNFVDVNLSVTNTGKYAGSEIVQLYVHDVKSSVDRPYKELKGFEKVSLNPGESKTVSITLDKRTFSFYDVKAKKWIAEPGEFEILVGASSRDIRLKGEFELK